MKPLYIIILILLSNLMIALCQANETDSLKKLLMQTDADTTRALLLIQLANTYRFSNPDSAMILTQQALLLSRKLNFSRGEVRALNALGSILQIQGEYPKALEMEFEALRISKNSRDPEEATTLNYIGSVYIQLSEYRLAQRYFRQALAMNERRKIIDIVALSGIGEAYEKMNQLDSASIYQLQANDLLKDMPRIAMKSLVLMRLGVIQARLGKMNVALGYYHAALENAYLTGDLLNQGRVQQRIAELYHQSHQPDSSLTYARLSFITCSRVSNKLWQLYASNLLVKLYQERSNQDSAFYYLQVSAVIKDSLFAPEKFQRLQLLTSNEQRRQQDILQAQAAFENKIRLYALLATLGVFLLLAVILYRNNRQKQKANALLQYQKNEIQNTLTELKTTQAQLVQREKMASLGELTAGIAHEIQNPLNFVNNFSDVTVEMLDEAEENIKSNQKEEAIKIIEYAKENLRKITHHGQRADAVVKGMLQHSRSNSGRKELIDINALADEYLRLSYHGLRAKDKNFNANFTTNFDEGIEKIEVAPQDIGTVLLNLYNNAFYAVNERRKQLDSTFEPTVEVSTKSLGESVEIIVRDNGKGIPQKVVGKIFQPFFTTKPTGHGTGLGLSLSYDIIKAHGGELGVQTKEGEGAEFIIHLPIKNG